MSARRWSGCLVHLGLVAAGVSQSAATTVYGMTIRRFWVVGGAAAVVLGLIATALGGIARARLAHRAAALGS